MDINNLIKTKGIVLSSTRYKESSKIINLFTEERGKINIFANGVLRPKSGMMLASENFVESEFILQQAKSNYYINSCEIVNSNIDIGLDLKAFLIGQMVCELVEMTMPENLIDKRAYNLVSKTLVQLGNSNNNKDIIQVGFLLKYISQIGFRPHIKNCSSCASTDYNNIYFSNEAGGLICGNCLENISDCVKLNKTDINAIVGLLYSKYEEYNSLNIDNINIYKLKNIIYKYVLYTTDLVELKSFSRLETLYKA